MLKHLPRVHVESAPFRSKPISSDMEREAARFELERRACQSLRKVLQLKLQQRRTREELVNQGIIPPLKSSASFHEQKRSLERARTEDYLKRKIQRRPERAELIRMHILEEVTAEESVLQKRARLADDLNDKISQRPGPMELIHKNILPVHSNIKTAFIETVFLKASDELSSAEEDSIDSQDSPLPCGTLTLTLAPSPAQDSTDSPLKLTTPLSACAQRITAESKQKVNPDHCIQKHKKPKDDKPKMKKLKYHEYIPPDQKVDKEAPPKLDSSYAKLLQQQQLFLHLQILNQQQRQHNTGQTQPQQQTDHELPKPSSVDAPLAGGLKAPAEDNTKSTSLPPNLEELKVAELKAELKLRGLTVSGTKSDLIERLRAHQAGRSSRDSTRAQPAGGAKEPGAEGAAKASKTAAKDHHSLAVKPNSSTRQIKNSGDNSSSPVSSTSIENSTLITELKKCKTEMPDYQASPTPQLNISIKEEQLSPIPASLYTEKCHLVHPATCPAMLVDKDLMLRQKDRQIEELKRLLLHNQRLVDMLKIKLERRKREEQKAEKMLFLRVVPPDKNNRCAKQPFSKGEFDVKVKQEIVDEDNMETGPQLNSKLTNGHAEQNGRHQQAVHRLLLQQQSKLLRQQQAIQMHSQREENRHKQENVCQEKKQKSPRHQQRMTLDSQQILLKQKIRLKQQKNLMQQRQSTECQQIQIQTKIDLKQPKEESSKVSPVCPEQKLNHLLPFNVKNNSMPAIVTDSNGNHFLITLTNHITEGEANGNVSKYITLQRLQWSTSKLPGHSSAQLPRVDNEARAIMHMGELTQQSTKTESAGLEQSRTVQQHDTTERLLEKSETSDTTGDSCSSLNKICSSLDFLFSPLSPNASSIDAKDTTQEDFIDIILKTGDISRFKPAPDPALNHLHCSSSSPSPSSPLLPLLSPAAAPCLDLINTTPSAPHKSPSAVEQKKTGRLEDFLESTTGKPLLGVEPDGPMTLIDDLHSQMLCTPSILDHPPSPMDTLDTELDTCLDERAVDTMDWLDLTVEDHDGKDLPKLATPTPPSVFSTDFLDTYDLETDWDSCL